MTESADLAEVLARLLAAQAALDSMDAPIAAAYLAAAIDAYRARYRLDWDSSDLAVT